jgi:hypothetical protein
MKQKLTLDLYFSKCFPIALGVVEVKIIFFVPLPHRFCILFLVLSDYPISCLLFYVYTMPPCGVLILQWMNQKSDTLSCCNTQTHNTKSLSLCVGKTVRISTSYLH